MENLQQLLYSAIEENTSSLHSAEEQRQELLSSLQRNMQLQLKEALEQHPEAQKVAERIDRLMLFQRLLRNIQMNLPLFEKCNIELRPNQLRSLQLLIEFLQAEGHGRISGYVKQPTGAGKTVLFGLLTHLCNVPSMILVPSTNLLTQTKKDLVKVVGIPEEDIGLVGAGSSEYDRQISIVTYQSHRSRFYRDKEYRAMAESRQLVVCDEAHRSLGKVTQESLEALDGEFDDLLTEKEQAAEIDVLTHLDRYTSSRALKIGFTATPKLAQKDVEDAFGILIAEEKHTDLVQAGILVPYRIVQADGVVTDKDLENYMTEDKEVEILHREQTYKKLLGKYVDVLQEYQKTKQAHEYPLRGVAFCVRITECDRFAQEAEDLGLRTRVLTSRETKGLSAEKSQELLAKAEQELTNGDIDLIVTVTKLAEGWDYPPANAAIWARASQSPALIMQGIGRTARKYTDKQERRKEWSYVFETNWSLKGKSRGKNPLRIADALAQMGEDPKECCTMMNGAHLEYQRKLSIDEYKLLIKEQFTPKEWAKMNAKEKYQLKIANKGIIAIASLFGIEGNLVGYRTIHLLLGQAIWGEEFGDPEKEEREEIASVIREQFTPKEWAAMGNDEKAGLQISKKGVMALATLFGVGESFYNHSVHIALGRAIWGEEFGDPEKEEREEIASVIREQFTPKEWANFINKEKEALKFSNKGLAAIARLFEIQGDPVGYRTIHLLLGQAIWGEEFGDPEKEEREEIALVIKEQFTPKEWAKMNAKEKRQLQVSNKGLVAITSLFGIEGNALNNRTDHLLLGQAIWGEEFGDPEKEEREEIILFIKQDFTPREWARMESKERKTLKILNRGLKALSTLLGIKNNGQAKNFSDHLLLGQAIWGEEFGDPEKEEREEIASVIREQFTPKEWAAMGEKEKKGLQIANRGHTALASLFGVKGNLGNHSVHLMFGQAIWGEEFGDPEKEEREEIASVIRGQFTPKEWAAMGKKEKKGLQIANRGIIAIARLFGIEGNPISHRTVHLLVGQSIWGEEFGDPEKEEREEIASMIKEQFTPQQWAKMKIKDKRQLKIAKKGMVAIASLFGVEGNPIDSRSIQHLLGQAIWGEAFDNQE